MKGMRTLGGAMVLLAGLAVPSLAGATLQYSTQDGVMRVSSKVEAKDVEGLKVQITPAVKVLVLAGVSGGSWEQGRDMAALVEKAEVTTVAHGLCTGWACSMMFLSGKSRMFSGAGRPESHELEIPFINYLPNYDCGGYHCTDISDWLGRHSKLVNADLTIYHKSVFTATTVTPPDFLIFFPAQAKATHGNVLHCAREIMEEKKKESTLADCLPMPGVTALNRGIVTTDEGFTHPSISVRDDMAAPAGSGYAKLEDPVDIGVALNDECRAIYTRFLHSDSPRAFVVSDKGDCFARFANSLRPHAEAQKACKASKAKCRFYAVDDKVVFVPFDKPLPRKAEVPKEDEAQ